MIRVMKKLLYIVAIVSAGAFFAACEPQLIEGPDPQPNISASTLQAGFQILGQYADIACTVPQSDGNFIKYTTSPATSVQVYIMKNGAKNILATGPSGVFNISPKRGQDPKQAFYVAAINPDASIVSFESSINVNVPQELSPEIKCLVSESGSKTWTWAHSDAPVWGNAGNSGAGSAFVADVVDGQWWGATPEELLGQLAHSGGVETGAESPNAYMVFDEDGNINTFGGDGSLIYSSTYSIKDFDDSRASGWELGKLVTADPAVLFPFSINEGGKTVTEFDLMYLDANYMTLVYTKGNGAGSWAEITWWKFKNQSDLDGALNGGSTRNWGWESPDGPVWGNAGNSGAGNAFTAGVVDGQWWGATPEELTGQLGHSSTGVATGEESFDAYMTFDVDGNVATYAADGTKIRSAEYKTQMYPDGRKENWELGKLTTTAPALLFPFSINEGGVEVTEFDVMYVDADHLTLVYTKGNGPGSWAEISWWKFAAK